MLMQRNYNCKYKKSYLHVTVLIAIKERKMLIAFATKPTIVQHTPFVFVYHCLMALVFVLHNAKTHASKMPTSITDEPLDLLTSHTRTTTKIHTSRRRLTVDSMSLSFSVAFLSSAANCCRSLSKGSLHAVHWSGPST